ncbi:MAG: hypothetical protein QOE72_4251, partial [Chloroflexota bacterium]|nr:hypothetical protein [Chloroflexota bacterium]
RMRVKTWWWLNQMTPMKRNEVQ